MRQAKNRWKYGSSTSDPNFNRHAAGCWLSIFKRSDNRHIALPSQLLNQLALIDDKGIVNLHVVGDTVYVVANRDWEASSQSWKPRVSELPTGSVLRLDIENGRLETVVGDISLPPAPTWPGQENVDTVWQLPHEVDKQGQLTYLAHNVDGRRLVYTKDLVHSGEPQLLGAIEGASEVMHILHAQGRLLVVTNSQLTAWKFSDGKAERSYVRPAGPFVGDVQLVTTSNGKSFVAWTDQGVERGYMQLFDFETGREIASHKVCLWCVQGDYLIAIRNSSVDRHHIFCVWNLVTDEQSPRFEWHLFDSVATNMTTSGPLALFTVCSLDGVVKL